MVQVAYCHALPARACDTACSGLVGDIFGRKVSLFLSIFGMLFGSFTDVAVVLLEERWKMSKQMKA